MKTNVSSPLFLVDYGIGLCGEKEIFSSMEKLAFPGLSVSSQHLVSLDPSCSTALMNPSHACWQ